jgi:hypothetical protein
VWPRLAPADVLVDSMRGRSKTWTRIRVNLRNVPENQRPPQEALEVDYDPWEGVEFTDEEREARRAQQRVASSSKKPAKKKTTPKRPSTPR